MFPNWSVMICVCLSSPFSLTGGTKRLVFKAASSRVFSVLFSDMLPFYPSRGLRHHSPAVPGTVEISHTFAPSQTGCHQQQKRDAAIHNSCLFPLKAPCYEKRGERKGYAGLDEKLSAKEEMEPLLARRLFIVDVIHISALFTLNILRELICSFSIIVRRPPLNLCSAFIILIKVQLVDVFFLGHSLHNRIMKH